MQAGGYGKVITHVIIGLKTVKGTKQLKLDPTIYDSLQKEKVLSGDVIYIEANSGMLLLILVLHDRLACCVFHCCSPVQYVFFKMTSTRASRESHLCCAAC